MICRSTPASTHSPKSRGIFISEAGRARPKNRPHGCSPFSRAMNNSRSAISRSCGKADGALIGRCGITDLVVESAEPEHGLRKGWFARAQAPAGVALTFECELGYTFDPAVWGQGFATEAACCVRDYARDVLRRPYAVSAIFPENARSRRVSERGGARFDGQMEVVGLTWDRYLWPLATGRATRLEPASTK